MRPEDLEQHLFDAAAAWAARQLDRRGVALVKLAPGDATEYPILIAVPDVQYLSSVGEAANRTYWVSLCAGFGSGYPWMGQPVDPGYATEKWTNRLAHGVWTGTVISRFLTALSSALKNIRGEHR